MAAPSRRLIPDGEPLATPQGWRGFVSWGGVNGVEMDERAERFAALRAEAKRYGMTVQKPGGRPPKIARDIAVHFVRIWQTNKQGTKAAADDWILNEWKPYGLTEPRHIRACSERARRHLEGWSLLALRGAENPLMVAYPLAIRPTKVHAAGEPVLPYLMPLPGCFGWIWAGGLEQAERISIDDAMMLHSPITASDS